MTDNEARAELREDEREWYPASVNRNAPHGNCDYRQREWLRRLAEARRESRRAQDIVAVLAQMVEKAAQALDAAGVHGDDDSLAAGIAELASERARSVAAMAEAQVAIAYLDECCVPEVAWWDGVPSDVRAAIQRLRALRTPAAPAPDGGAPGAPRLPWTGTLRVVEEDGWRLLLDEHDSVVLRTKSRACADFAVACLNAAVSAGAAPTAPCRRCVDCEGSPHHWIEDPLPHSATDWACKHCGARGIVCPICDGDEVDQVGCALCSGDGVAEVVGRTVIAAPSEEFPGWIIGNAEETQWRRWGDAGPEWTPHRDQALRFARRADAEAFAAEDLDAWKLVRHPPSTGAGRSVATDPLDELVRQCVALGDVHTALCRLVMHLGCEIRDRDRQLAARLTGAPEESAEPWYALSITGDTEANHLVRGDEALRAALRDAFFIDTNPDHLAAEEAARWAHVQDPARWRAGVWEEHGEDYVVTIVRVGGAIRPETTVNTQGDRR